MTISEYPEKWPDAASGATAVAANTFSPQYRNSLLICYMIVYIKLTLLFRNTKVLTSGRGSFLALSATGNAADPPVHHNASMDPGLAPWCVLWAFKVGKNGK